MLSDRQTDGQMNEWIDICDCKVAFTTEKVLRISSKTGKEEMKRSLLICKIVLNKNHKAILLMLWGGGVQEECFISDSHKAIFALFQIAAKQYIGHLMALAGAR